MSDQAARLLEELAGVQAYLGAAQEVLKGGFMPDITSLDNRVSELCLKIQAADANTQKQCMPGLSQLMLSLDECESGIRQWHEATIKVEQAK